MRQRVSADQVLGVCLLGRRDEARYAACLKMLNKAHIGDGLRKINAVLSLSITVLSENGKVTWGLSDYGRDECQGS